ncbi:MAG: hypothetical protein JWN48_4128 [Myxococcaceae bacterium]|nr:hypothetical protein [Myxococcaceae bacterium]
MNVGRWACTMGALGLVALGCDDKDGKTAGEMAGLDGGGHTPTVQPDGAIPRTQPDGSTPGFIGPQGGQDGGPPARSDALVVRGRVASAPGDKRQKGPGDAAVEHSVTHIMAVNPSSANPVRYLAPIADDGSFSIEIDLNKPWIIVLVDSHRVGSDMVAGVLRAADFDLDSLAATRAGALELGDLSVDPSSGAARATILTSDLLTALGLSEAAARLLGAMDDISLRYVNPDVDGNGKIDVQEGVRYTLDFHLRYSMIANGQMVTLKDLLNSFSKETITEARYGLGSAIALWDPMRFGSTTAADYRIRFPMSAGTFQAPPLQGSFAAGEWIDQDSYFYTSAGSNTLGISFDQTEPFPVGTYVFEVKGTALTFTEVRTHTLAELNSSDDLIIPFLKVNAPDTACSDWSCPVSGLDYRWMKHTESGWTLASEEEIALIIPQQGGFLGFQPSGDPSKRLEYVIPGHPTSGTIPFALPNNRQGGVADAEIAALTVGQLCHLGVSYDDTLGMRIFQGWQQSPACDGL